MFCEHCGHLLEDGNIFCSNCGKKIIEENQTDEMIIKDPPRKRNTNIFLLIILLMILIIVTSSIILFWPNINSKFSSVINKLNPNNDTSEKSTDSTKSINSTVRYSQQTNYTSSSTYSMTTTTTSQVIPKEVVNFDMNTLNDIIMRYTSTSNVSIAILDFDTKKMYETANSGSAFVATGFYAPLYIAAYSTDNSIIHEKADIMMETMDNDEANAIIKSLGGFQSINEIFSNEGFTQTIFEREFGNKKASQLGYENYTSAREAVYILEQLYIDKGYQKMGHDLRNDDISLPSGVTIYAHSGQGIGTSFNIFAIVETPTKSYSVAILTSEISSDGDAVKNKTVPLITELLAAIQKQMKDLN